MRTAVILVMVTSILTFFVSCGPHGQSTPVAQNQKVRPADGPNSRAVPQTGSPVSQGTADSGGGNTFMGKPLESYKVSPKNLEAYKTFIAPWLESEAIKNTGIGNALASILSEKIWYMIPSELKQLSAEKIGSAVGTDQAALQDFKQIWLNSLIFEKMKLSDQAVLIVHELLMGLKLLKLDSKQAECLAFRRTYSDSDPHYCRVNISKEIRGKPADLNQIDYAQIRSAAALIQERGLKINLKELEEILGGQGFIEISIKKTVSLEQLAQMIETTKLIKTWPLFGYDLGKFFDEDRELLLNTEKRPAVTLSSNTTCNFDILISKDNFSIMIFENGKNIFYKSRWTSPIEMHMVYDSAVGFSVYVAHFSMLKTADKVIKGSPVIDVTLKFLGNGLLGFNYNKNVCLNEDCSQAGQGLTGENILCYTRSSITFNSVK